MPWLPESQILILILNTSWPSLAWAFPIFSNQKFTGKNSSLLLPFIRVSWAISESVIFFQP
jgi:hypothetical protein